MKKKKDQNKNLENGQLSRKKSSQKSLSVKMTNSINVATYEKYNKIYSAMPWYNCATNSSQTLVN